MFDTVVEVGEWEVRDSCPCDFPPEQVTVWDVLAGRVDPGADAIRALKSVNPRDLDAAARADFVSAWEQQDAWIEAQKLSALDAMSAPEPVVTVDDPTDRGFARSRSGSPVSRPGWRWGVPRGGRRSGCGSPPPSPTGSR